MSTGIQNQRRRTEKSQLHLIEKYQFLVDQIAEKFEDTEESGENLKEVGYIGLLNAVHLYDSSVHKVSFKTYAQILITEEMHQYLMNHYRKVDRPDWLVHMNREIDEFVLHYRKEYQKFPLLSEIANHLNIQDLGVQEVLKARDSLKEPRLIGEIEQNKTYLEIKPDLEKIRSQSFQSFKLPIEDVIVLRKALKRLKKLQEGIVYYLFVMDLNQTRLAKILGISPREADQLKKEVYNQLQ